MTLWFVAIAAVGLVHIADDPGVFAALNPMHAIRFLGSHGYIGLVTLGAVFLAVTGAEALYADLGHFGRRPIQTAWLYFVLPALILNYFGQGALVLADPTAIANPFYRMVPSWALYPMIALATAATIIASQAVITGAFSLTNQAVQLGLLPRLQIRRTSATQAGQIFIPRINALLLIGVLLLVLLFRSSNALASAYGVAVTGTMLVDGSDGLHRDLAGVELDARRGARAHAAVHLDRLHLPHRQSAQGAARRLGAALDRRLLVTVMLTWRRGARILAAKTRRLEMPVEELIKLLEKKPPPRVPGTAVFLTAAPESAPTALLHSLKHYKVLHENNVILTIVVENVPARRATGPRGDGADRRSLHARDPAFRLHGDAQHPEGTRHRAQGRAGASTSCRRRSSCRGAWCAPMRARACRFGRTSCSSSSPRTPTMHRAISSSRPTASSRSARR